MAATPPPLALDTPAPDFRLPGTDGRTYAFDDIAGENGTVIVFICNHCPYVTAVIDRLVSDARSLMADGIGFAAICSNDASAYPANSFEAMQRFAQAHAFPDLPKMFEAVNAGWMDLEVEGAEHATSARHVFEAAQNAART